MIEIKGVTKRFGTFTAISNLSLNVDKASVYGLVGYNGAGKTTLLKTVAGVYKPEEGEVNIFGENVFDNDKIKQRMFYVPDEIFFERNATIESMSRFYKGYYPKFDDRALHNLADAFGLDTKKRINGFSKGMQRQAEIILALATLPAVLLLDESFDGLDPAKRNLVKNLMLEYMAEKDCSIIISSHNLHELVDICDHIALLNGKKVAMDCSVNDMSGSRCKFRVIFNTDVPPEDFSGIDLKNFNKDGKIITFTVSGDIDAVEAKLQAMSPILVERFPLTLEEIFLDEMDANNYDFKNIFGAESGEQKERGRK